MNRRAAAGWGAPRHDGRRVGDLGLQRRGQLDRRQRAVAAPDVGARRRSRRRPRPGSSLPTTPLTSGSFGAHVGEDRLRARRPAAGRAPCACRRRPARSRTPIASFTPGFVEVGERADRESGAAPRARVGWPRTPAACRPGPPACSSSGSLVLAEAKTSGLTPWRICAASSSEPANERRGRIPATSSWHASSASVSDAAADTTTGVASLALPFSPQPATVSAAATSAIMDRRVICVSVA